MAEGLRRRYERWRQLTVVAGKRVKHRTISGKGRQTALAAAGITIAVALVLLVTSIAFGLASQGILTSSSTDYWIVPEDGRSSAVISVDDPQFGTAHSANERLTQYDSIISSTPALVDVVRLQSDHGEPERVVLIGIIPSAREHTSVSGISTAQLVPDDPYYANGSYNGRWTGQAVASQSAAAALHISAGDTIRPAKVRPGRQNRSFTVVNIQNREKTERNQPPIIIAHLSEVQAITGGTDTDRADQFLINTNGTIRTTKLESIYSHDRIVSREKLLINRLRGDDLSFAMSVAAIIVVGVVGTLFIITTIGFEIVSNAEERAVMASLGISGSSRAMILVMEVFVTAVIGGIGGTALWVSGATISNIVSNWMGQADVVVVRPIMVPYGFVVAIGIALLASPILLLMARRDTLEALSDQ